MANPIKKEAWQERFDKLGEIYTFPRGNFYKVEAVINGFVYKGRCDTEPIKSFIAQEIASAEKKIIDIILKSRIDGEQFSEGIREKTARVQAVADIITTHQNL